MSGTTVWTPEHFVGGHPALDLANTVYDRVDRSPTDELLGDRADVAGWLAVRGLAPPGAAVGSLTGVHRVREAVWAVFSAIAKGGSAPAEPLGALFTAAGTALAAGRIAPPATWNGSGDAAGYLALLAVDAYFTLPAARIGACPRCGWLFVDTSRNGRRRWCSMRTCGNRDKVTRHRGGS